MIYQNKYINSVMFGTGLMALTYIIAERFGWVNIKEINWLEIFAVWTSYICTLLCVVQSRWNYPIGIVTTAAYSYLFFQWNLPSVAWFNLYLVGSLTYGWFRWKSDTETIPVTHVQLVWWLGYVGLGVAVYAFLYMINTYFGYAMTGVDVTVAVLSGVAQFLLDNKKIETWAVWIVVNIFSIYLYYNQGLYLVAIQYIYFLGNAFLGAYLWYRSMERYDTATV